MLTSALRQVLSVLQAAEDGGEEIGVIELSRRLGRSKGNVSGLLTRLRERGFVSHAGPYKPYRVLRRVEPHLHYWVFDDQSKELRPWQPELREKSA